MTAIDAEIDSKAHPDSNLQHVRHMFEGYRARTLGQDENPYAPDSARGYSWLKGWALADKDFGDVDGIEHDGPKRTR